MLDVSSPPFVAPGDLPDISTTQFKRMAALRERLAPLTAQREEVIRREGLDPAFCLPAANWASDAPNDFRKAYAHLRDGDFGVLNRLRFWSQAFTGYNIMMFRYGCGLNSVNPVPAGHDVSLHNANQTSDEWVERWRLMVRALPRQYVMSPPRLMGEAGWDMDGILVSHDTYVYQERLCLLREAGVLDWLARLRAPRILEIGGGYGALCNALLGMFPKASYAICDLPESLMFSGLYLAATQPRLPVAAGGSIKRLRRGVTLVPNYLFHHLRDMRFDLVINTLSMSEMSEHQIRVYAEGIAGALAPQGGCSSSRTRTTAIWGWPMPKASFRRIFRITAPSRRPSPWRVVPRICGAGRISGF